MSCDSRARRLRRPPAAVALSLLVLALALMVLPAWAQPDPNARVGLTVADARLHGYRFERLSIASADGQRRYRVHLAVPTGAAPARGFPVACMLDGSAVLMALEAPLLEQLAASARPPVLVLVAHDNDLRIDGPARTLDYTPRRGEGGGEEFDASGNGRRSGGADAFLALIVERIMPAVRQRTAVDEGRRMLWGHSYGGLFALHALATRPDAFTDYVAVDPSLWWGEGFIVGELEQAARRHPAAPARLSLMQGVPAASGRDGKAGPGGRGAGNAEAGQRLEALFAELPGVEVRRMPLPGLSHGQTLGAAIAPALRSLAASADVSP